MGSAVRMAIRLNLSHQHRRVAVKFMAFTTNPSFVVNKQKKCPFGGGISSVSNDKWSCFMTLKRGIRHPHQDREEGEPPAALNVHVTMHKVVLSAGHKM